MAAQTRPAALTPAHARERLAIVGLFLLVVGTFMVVSNLAIASLSAVRAYVAGEGRWSKAQLQSVRALHLYAITRHQADYERFEQSLEVMLGDRRARETLSSPAPDFDAARAGFITGRNHPDDLDGMIWMFRRFRRVPLVARAIEIWREGDIEIDRLALLGAALRDVVSREPLDQSAVQRVLIDIDRTDRELSRLEDLFSATLGETARWTRVWMFRLTLSASVLLLALSGYFSWRVLRRLSRSEQALRESEVQLRESQKLRAVGQLAGGIAHDFNNLLTVIIGYASELGRLVEPRDARHEAATEILRAAERAAKLTGQLLAFSRRQVIEPAPVDLGTVASDITAMLQRLLGPNIHIRVRTAPSLGMVSVDRGQIEQVIVNLALNARDAMPAGGEVGIETTNADDGLAESDQALPCVALTVTDEGVGMDEATRARIFEPFFTTKEVGKGTGLGLAVVYGIVQQSGGRVDVHSVPGRGSRFRVVLPRSPDGSPAPHREAQSTSALTGHEHILLVENEPTVRMLAHDSLTRLGYVVIPAVDGADALLRASAKDAPLDLVVTDVMMPGMDGPTLATHLIQRHPNVRVLFISGFAGEVAAQSMGRHPILHKPFTPDQLARKVRDVLDDGLPTSAELESAS